MDWVSMFDFNYVSEANNVPVFSRIGMEDRNILGVLGSLFLFMLMFLVTQVIYVFLKNSRKARVVLQKIGLETSYRTLFIIFFTETYMDMLLGGLINTENFDLLYDSKNWGS
jgi:heme A synthase